MDTREEWALCPNIEVETLVEVIAKSCGGSHIPKSNKTLVNIELNYSIIAT